MHIQGRLGRAGLPKSSFGPLKADRCKIESQYIRRFIKPTTRHREMFGKILAHPDNLRTLTRKKEDMLRQMQLAKLELRSEPDGRPTPGESSAKRNHQHDLAVLDDSAPARFVERDRYGCR